ncbi:MAG: hypothetical protein ACFN4U_03600, partial [Candidatus Absconditicoccaceae bacterium]
LLAPIVYDSGKAIKLLQRTVSFFFFEVTFVRQKGRLFFPFKVRLSLSISSDFLSLFIYRGEASSLRLWDWGAVYFSL